MHAAASVALISDAQKASIESSLGGYSEEQADSQQPGMQSWELITDPQVLLMALSPKPSIPCPYIQPLNTTL